MEEFTRHGEINTAAMKADVDRKTAHKYIQAGPVLTETAAIRDWRTRENPFMEVWSEIEILLKNAPELEAKTIFGWLNEQHPEKFQEGQLRTLQRQIHRWRSEVGPPKEVWFTQAHRPGEASQTDFTWATELNVTINGESFINLLCVFVLPYSNWQWATVCMSESMIALRRGVQSAVFRLGRITKFHQTDHSTAATHHIRGGKSISGPELHVSSVADDGTTHVFNQEYIGFMKHLGMSPRATSVGAKEQNGDVEASHRALKQRLAQALMLRGNRDFTSREAWEEFVQAEASKGNQHRCARLLEELTVMKELNVERLHEYTELQARVTQGSTINVKQNIYSVPARLIGETLKVHMFEDKIEAYYAGNMQLRCERLRGQNKNRVDYRHVIWSLVRKPGAFARYVHREAMFPSVVFRKAYDAIQKNHPGFKGDLEYLRILHLAASTMESDVETALSLLLEENNRITIDGVKQLTSMGKSNKIPEMKALCVDLTEYDALLSGDVK
jgi:hypothetical protein